MFGFFSAKNEICDVFYLDGKLHVLINQPRRDKTVCRSNTTSGFLIFDRSVSRTQRPGKIYTPKIALLPALGATNDGLLSYLRRQENIYLEFIDANEIGKSNRYKMDRAITNSHRTAVRSRALANSRTKSEAFRAASQILNEEARLVRVQAYGDDSRLMKTIMLLKDIGLAREETGNALKFVVDHFIVHREDKKFGLAKRRQIAAAVEHLIVSHPQPRP